MSTEEMKLDLFRKIDNLSDQELNKVYPTFLAILSSSEKHNLTSQEMKAVDEALNNPYDPISTESVLSEARQRYKNLKFR
ncbi:MAG: hypothetical protein HC905_15715 [Bacteroidales bacterium]|nr:hypothetical protein [Bacteroidales bacterium]